MGAAELVKLTPGLWLVWISLEISYSPENWESRTPEKQIRSFLQISERKATACCHGTCAQALFPGGSAFPERYTPFSQHSPSLPLKARGKITVNVDFPFEAQAQCGPPESSLLRLSQVLQREEKELEAALGVRVQPAWRSLPAFPPLSLRYTSRTGHARMRCQVKYKQSSDWIIIYSVLNLN